MYLQTIAEDQATGRVAEIYDAQKAQMGFCNGDSKVVYAAAGRVADLHGFH
jgi:hypothetical protein